MKPNVLIRPHDVSSTRVPDSSNTRSGLESISVRPMHMVQTLSTDMNSDTAITNNKQPVCPVHPERIHKNNIPFKVKFDLDRSPEFLQNTNQRVNKVIKDINHYQEETWNDVRNWLYQPNKFAPPPLPDINCQCDCTDQTFRHIPQWRCKSCGVSLNCCTLCALPAKCFNLMCTSSKRSKSIPIPELNVVNMPLTKPDNLSKKQCPFSISGCVNQFKTILPRSKCFEGVCYKEAPPNPRPARIWQRLCPSLFYKNEKKKRSSTLIPCINGGTLYDDDLLYENYNTIEQFLSDSTGALVGLTAKAVEGIELGYNIVFPSQIHKKIGTENFLIDAPRTSEAPHLRYHTNSGYEDLILQNKPTTATGNVFMDFINSGLDSLTRGDSDKYIEPQETIPPTEITGNEFVDSFNQAMDMYFERYEDKIGYETRNLETGKDQNNFSDKLLRAIEYYNPISNTDEVDNDLPELSERITNELGCTKSSRTNIRQPTLFEKLFPYLYGKENEYCRFCNRHPSDGSYKAGTILDYIQTVAETLPKLCCVKDEQYVDFTLKDSGLKTTPKGANFTADLNFQSQRPVVPIPYKLN